jgi:hypothetical protein
MNRFIGGCSIQHAYRHIIQRIPSNIIPIYDFAKEGTTTYSESKQTLHCIRKDIEWLNNQSYDYTKHPWAYALKLSSVLHYNPHMSLSFLIRKSHGPIFLDAEHNALKSEEQTYYPFLLSEQASTNEPIKVFKTYQMYRKDAMDELVQDVYQYPKLGIKLVRGAYLHVDKSHNVLWSTIHKTHAQYDKAIRFLCSEEIHRKRELSIIFATHNRMSMELILHKATKYPFLKQKIATAQLLGMRDDLSQLSNLNGVQVYKYVPYGNFMQTYPYLIRRLFENIKMIEHMV